MGKGDGPRPSFVPLAVRGENHERALGTLKCQDGCGRARAVGKTRCRECLAQLDLGAQARIQAEALLAPMDHAGDAARLKITDRNALAPWIRREIDEAQVEARRDGEVVTVTRGELAQLRLELQQERARSVALEAQLTRLTGSAEGVLALSRDTMALVEATTRRQEVAGA